MGSWKLLPKEVRDQFNVHKVERVSAMPAPEDFKLWLLLQTLPSSGWMTCDTLLSSGFYAEDIQLKNGVPTGYNQRDPWGRAFNR
jgi:hypothetical protein